MDSALEHRWREIARALDLQYVTPPYQKYRYIVVPCAPPGSCEIHVNMYGKIGPVPGASTAQRILVISHIAIFPEGAGHFRTFLYMLLDLPGFREHIDAIMIECLHNPRFEQTLLRNGWIQEYGNFFLRL